MKLRETSRFLAVVVLLAAGLAGCSGDDGSSGTESGTGMTSTASTTAGSTTGAGTQGSSGASETGSTGTTGTTGSTGSTGTTGSMTTGGLDGGFCAHQCAADGDCLILGMSYGFACEGGFCVGEASVCASDEACVALFSGWSMSCTAGGGECDLVGQVCVKALGEGRCALPPGDVLKCADLGMDEVMREGIDGGSVTVCAHTRAECDAGTCALKCASNDHCTSEAYPVCNVGTGACECGSDAECATLGQPWASVCVGGRCGCPNDQACVASGVGDVCKDGLCGCSSDGACAGVPNPFDGGSIACVEF